MTQHLLCDLLANHFFQQARRFAHHVVPVHVFRREDLPARISTRKNSR
jgi:hypothetical protein